MALQIKQWVRKFPWTDSDTIGEALYKAPRDGTSRTSCTENQKNALKSRQNDGEKDNKIPRNASCSKCLKDNKHYGIIFIFFKGILTLNGLDFMIENDNFQFEVSTLPRKKFDISFHLYDIFITMLLINVWKLNIFSKNCGPGTPIRQVMIYLQ